MFQLGPARIPQGQQFPVGTRINGSHQLAQGLGFMAVAQGQLAYDLIAGTAGALTGTLAQKTIRNGQALAFTGATGVRLTWPTTTAAQWVNANSFTVSALGLFKGTDFAAGSNSYPVLLKFANSGSHILCSFENNGGTINFSATADNLTPVIGTTTIGNFASTNALGFSADNVVALYTWRLNGTTCDCFINGVLVDTLTMSSHGAAVTAAISTASAGAGWSAAGAIQAWWVHNRPLDQAEIVQLATSPWCMLANVAAPDPYLFDGGGGAAGVTGTSATTNANDTSSASGTTTIVGTSATTNANDTSSASGTTKILGTSATTNANDTSSASGTTKILGASATTNANDTSAASGTTKVVGTSATTNANDTSSASGSVGSSVSGTVAYTNANDTSSASGTTKILGTSGTTNANDAGAASGNVGIRGTAAAVNANDTASAIGDAGAADVVVTPPVGHAGNRKRRVIIDDVIYLGTDEQIEARLWEILQQRKPKKQPVKQRAKKQKKPVELKNDYEPIPVAIDVPRFEQVLSDSYRHEDSFMQGMLHSMWQRFLEDEEDVEILLLS
jgi:hypothetical protein